MDKKIIRKEIQEKLKKISDKDRKSFEEILYKKLFENENFKNANCIALTIPFGTEINTYRIGFGGGYYDRYLKDFKGYTISLAFKEQIVEKVPTNEFDLPVDLVITN